MPTIPDDDVDFIVRIKDITNPSAANAAIVVRPTVVGDGSVIVGGSTSDPLGTDVKFKLNKAMQTKYKFDTHPICVFDKAAGQTNCPGGASAPTFPNGWSIACKDPSPAACVPEKNDKKVVLHIPVLSQGADFKYKLFLVDKTNNAKVVIDPKIGCCQYDKSTFQAFIDIVGVSAEVGVGIIAAVAMAIGIATAKAFMGGAARR